MSTQSKFYQVTPQILLEYNTDQYKITNTKSAVGESPVDFYMYIGEDGNQYCVTTQNIPDTKYINAQKTSFYYGGTDVDEYDLDINNDYIYGSDIYVNNKIVGTILKDDNNFQNRRSFINCDTIKLYISTGYVMNSIAGYSLKVKAKVTTVSTITEDGRKIVKRINDYLNLLDWYMPKELLKNKIHWLSNPLYMNSCFYDRYIEIKFPAPLDCALNNRNIDYVYEYHDENDEITFMRGNIDKNADILIEFATVQPDYVTLVDKDSNFYEQEFTLDVPKVLSIKHNSNSNNFNVRVFEDPETHCILYYPVYGDINNAKEFDINTMLAIETGVIPMVDFANLDSANDGMDDFIEMYGDEVFRWVIINELTVTYNYDFVIHNDIDNKSVTSYTEYFTNTIDYTGKTREHGEFWKSKFIPYIKQRNNMSCKSIIVSYTAHLFNRMNNMDIVRTASMTIQNPYRYSLATINTNNITQYKIVNKLGANTVINMENNKNGEVKEKNIRSYYDTTNILAKTENNGISYPQGKMVLYLKHENNNYMIRLYKLNESNIRVPYDLTGNVQYKLVFPSISGSKIQVFPNKDSENYNLGIGSLIFYITNDIAKSIMSVPASERYFALTTHIENNQKEETTLYEGVVQWYT